MHREPDVGFDPGSPGSRPGPKAGTKPLRHPGIPTPMFIAECPQYPNCRRSHGVHRKMNIKKMWFMYTMEYYSAIRNDKYPTFASKWMELEGIMLSEVSQSDKDNYYMVSLLRGI